MDGFVQKYKQAVCLLITYTRANLLLLFHYKKDRFLDGKWFRGGKHGRFTANGWQWVVDDYHACRRAKVNLDVPWPVSPRVGIVCPENIVFHPDDLNNFQSFGIYYQAIGRITIGHGTYLAPNVGIITANHSTEDLSVHDTPKPVTLGENCWIGMNAVILPGVVLGPHTIVGAGAVVTKSFPDGHCVIAGNPAHIIRTLLQEEKNQEGVAGAFEQQGFSKA